MFLCVVVCGAVRVVCLCVWPGVILFDVFLWHSHKDTNNIFRLFNPVYAMNTCICKLHVCTKQAKYEQNAPYLCCSFCVFNTSGEPLTLTCFSCTGTPSGQSPCARAARCGGGPRTRQRLRQTAAAPRRLPFGSRPGRGGRGGLQVNIPPV